ncbi:MAG TPA: DUF3298 and DUF4163 domain-containing protein [Pyrinomonadaceae bacterium]|nr:DUF3298 and DUF4163 domain-containing protein [Pyrinomonadaceae bacterium]
MNSLGRVLLISLMLAVAGVTACSKKSTTDEPLAPGNNSGQQLQQADGGATSQGQTKLFKGTIGNNLGLQMKLMREGERLAGSYFYEKVGTRIDLRGTIDPNGKLTLDEFDTAGKQTGAFHGNWKTEETGLVVITGNWKAPNSNKQTPFSLQEEPIEFSSGVEVVTRRINENNKKLKYEIDAEYPQLNGSGSPNYEKFNQTIRNLVTKKVAGFKADMASNAVDTELELPAESANSDLHIGYNIELAKDDLISVMLVVGSYSAGAAHPNSYSEVVNFDLGNGKLLNLSDLFQPGSKYLPALAAYCIADLKKQGKAKGEESMLDDEWIQRGAGPEAENYESWTIGKRGLGIVFDAYQVAAYAAGPQHVFVPYSALKDILKPDGPLAQFVK